MKLPRLVINSFRRRCQLKVDNIEASLVELKGQECIMTMQLEQCQRLTSALTDQWKAVADILAVSEQFVTGQSGEPVPGPGHESMPTTLVQGQTRLGVEVATGAVAGAAMVAQVAIEDTATFRTNATDVKAGSLAEAGGEYSMVAEDRTGELGELYHENNNLLLDCHLFQMCEQSRDNSFEIW
jgi:hypothetical protein